MTAAYGTLANRGVYCPPRPIVKIVGPDGKEVKLEDDPCERRIDQGIADTVTQVLEKDTSNPAGTGYDAFRGLAGGSRPIAGKTGTSQDNSAAWFVGYTPEMAASVAVFNQKETSKKLEDVPGREGGNVFGAYSAGIWRDALEPVLRDRSWSFPPEDPEVVNGDSVPVPSVVGLDPAAAIGLLAASRLPAPGCRRSARTARSRRTGSPSSRRAGGARRA